MTSAQLLEEIEKDDEKRADLKRCVMEMEMQVESSLSRKHFAKMRAPSWANLLNETGLEDRVNLGVFWPRQVWLANEPTKSFPEALKQKYKGIVGVWRDKKHGEPPNSISSFQVEAMKTQYVKQLASSSTNMKGTVREIAKELGASLTGFKAELKTDAEGESSVAFVDAGALDINKAIQKKRALKEQGSTSDEDWHACMPQHSVQKAEKKKRESNSSEGSSGSSRRRAQTNKSRKKEDRPRGRREQEKKENKELDKPRRAPKPNKKSPSQSHGKRSWHIRGEGRESYSIGAEPRHLPVPRSPSTNSTCVGLVRNVAGSPRTPHPEAEAALGKARAQAGGQLGRETHGQQLGSLERRRRQRRADDSCRKRERSLRSIDKRSQFD